MKRFFSILMILIGTMGTASIGWALDWYMVLNFSIPDPFATNGALQSRLILGVDPAADDNFNHQWDTIAFPTGSSRRHFLIRNIRATPTTSPEANGSGKISGATTSRLTHGISMSPRIAPEPILSSLGRSKPPTISANARSFD